MSILLWPAFALVGSLLADWPWRSGPARAAGGAFRVLLTLVLAISLYWDAGAGIGRAWRRALVTSDRITSALPAFPAFTEYQSGVTTMSREADKDIRTTIPFIVALAIIGVTPVLRLGFRRAPPRVSGAPSGAA
jgi:hypothetical protein